MVKNTAQFHMTMLLSRYSNSLADMFQMEFQHRERERSSDRSEITEINDYWYARICEYDARAAKDIADLPNSTVQEWIRAFDSRIINHLIALLDNLCPRR